MARTIAALTGGMLVGILAMLVIDNVGPASEEAADTQARDIVAAPKMAPATAEKHRVEQYAGITSIEQLMGLPTEFARSSATYAVAGRADSAGVQDLIFAANRIADDEERVRLLNILFFRLTEIDPPSALALSRTADFTGVKSIERTVWRAWARMDLEDALFAAKSQTSIANQKSAAQSLYAAFGYMGNATTDRIEEELGMGPDRWARGRYLYQLADSSPGEAIAFINGLERGVEQQEYVSWLANYLSLQDPATALRYGDLFNVAADGDRFRSTINRVVARENPAATIDRLLASGSNPSRNGELYSAIRALASKDLEAAKAYFEQARSSDVRQSIGSTIVSEMAKKDPAEALLWARANESSRFPMLQMSALSQIAETDPQLALSEAGSVKNAQHRSMLLSNVVQMIARNDPANAVNYLNQIEDGNHKLEASQQLASTWVRTDPDAAIAWILAQDKETASQMLPTVAYRLAHSDIDAAIRLLPNLDAGNQSNLRQQIAQRLATDRSPAEAQAFVQQFEGQPGYDALLTHMIAGVAERDIPMARQLADQLADSKVRDRAYAQIISQQAQVDPAQAARLLSSIRDEATRGMAVAQIAGNWSASDQGAATRWVKALPAGPSRDDAIVQMSGHWRDGAAEQDELIASIKDREKRGQAKVRRIYNLMQTNPAKARELMQDEDISNEQRQQLEAVIGQLGSRF